MTIHGRTQDFSQPDCFYGPQGMVVASDSDTENPSDSDESFLTPNGHESDIYGVSFSADNAGSDSSSTRCPTPSSFLSELSDDDDIEYIDSEDHERLYSAIPDVGDKHESQGSFL